MSLMIKLASLIPHYGNWGGPFYSAGSFGDRPTEEIDFDYPAADDLDEAFKKHDVNYAIMNDEFTADWDLVSEITILEFPVSKWSKPPSSAIWSSLYWLIAFWVFFFRAGLKKMGILPRYKDPSKAFK